MSPPSARRGRPAGTSTALIAIATVLAIVAALTTWVKVQALETDAWVDLSDELIQEELIQEALAVYIVDELYVLLDLTAEIEDALPDDLAGLAGPLTAALRGPATDGVQRLLASEQFRAVWSAVNRTAHRSLVSILRNDTGEGVSTANGDVVLDLRQLLILTAESLGLSGDRIAQLPADAGQIVVFRSDELAAVQSAVRLLDFMSWFVFLVVVVVYAAAVYLAKERRIAVLRRVGFSLVVAGVVVLVARSVAVQSLTESLVKTPSNRPLATLTASVATGLIRQTAWSGIIYGVVIALFATLLGTGRRPAGAARRAVAPAFNGSAWAVAGGTALVVLILVWWSPGRSFDRLVSALVVIALVVGAAIAVRRRTMQEYPDMTFAEALAPIAGGVSRGGRGDTPAA